MTAIGNFEVHTPNRWGMGQITVKGNDKISMRYIDRESCLGKVIDTIINAIARLFPSWKRELFAQAKFGKQQVAISLDRGSLQKFLEKEYLYRTKEKKAPKTFAKDCLKGLDKARKDCKKGKLPQIKSALQLAAPAKNGKVPAGDAPKTQKKEKEEQVKTEASQEESSQAGEKETVKKDTPASQKPETEEASEGEDTPKEKTGWLW